MKALIDTCIIIDALQNREPFCKAAQEIFIAVANRKFAGFLSAKAVTDIYYLTRKYLHNEKESKSVLNALFSLFDMLDTAGIDCRRAVFSELPDFEDAVMTESAVRSQMDCIVTRNQKDYINASIPVFSPEEFMKKLTEEKSDL